MMAITFDQVYEALNMVWYAPPWEPSVAARHLIELLHDECAPSPGECAAVSVTKPKTAALVYDRVWGLAGEVPECVRFGGLSEL